MDARDFEKWLDNELGITLTARTRRKLEEAVENSRANETFYSSWKRAQRRWTREQNLKACIDEQTKGFSILRENREPIGDNAIMASWSIPEGGWGHVCSARENNYVCWRYGSTCGYCGVERPQA